jgi:hypothetical protein
MFPIFVHNQEELMGTEKKVVIHNDGMLGFTLFLTTVGAAVYFVQQSTGFWGAILGVLKALVWPAMLMYKVLQNLQL